MYFFNFLGQKTRETLLDFDNLLDIRRECLCIQLSTLSIDILDRYFTFPLKNFDFSRTFLLSLSEISGGTLEISALFLELLDPFFFLEFSYGFLGVNFTETYCQNDLLLLSVFKMSHSAS